MGRWAKKEPGRTSIPASCMSLWAYVEGEEDMRLTYENFPCSSVGVTHDADAFLGSVQFSSTKVVVAADGRCALLGRLVGDACVSGRFGCEGLFFPVSRSAYGLDKGAESVSGARFKSGEGDAHDLADGQYGRGLFVDWRCYVGMDVARLPVADVLCPILESLFHDFVCAGQYFYAANNRS